MLKLDGILGANPPALTATCAFGHIVFEGSPAVLIDNIQGRSRAIFAARQTPVTVVINPKVRHIYYPIYNYNIIKNLKIRNPKQIPMTKAQMSKTMERFRFN
jgi:hypothetical protein